MRVVGYVRVSTLEQSAEGVSLDAQRAKVEGYAALHGYELVAVEVDGGASAKTLSRPGLERALSRLDRGEADGILISKLDRISRSVKDWNSLIDGYFSVDAGKHLFSVGDSINTNSAAGRLVLNVLMSVAQWERESVVERTRDALAHKRSKSERLGTIPYGKEVGTDGRTLVDVPQEVAVLDRMREWAADGWSPRRIARELTVLGIPTKSGAAGWSHTSVISILGRNAK